MNSPFGSSTLIGKRASQVGAAAPNETKKLPIFLTCHMLCTCNKDRFNITLFDSHWSLVARHILITKFFFKY